MAFGSEFFQQPLTSIDPQGRLMDNIVKGAQANQMRASTNALNKETEEKYSPEQVAARKKSAIASTQQSERVIANKDKLDRNMQAQLDKELATIFKDTNDAQLEATGSFLNAYNEEKDPKVKTKLLNMFHKMNPDLAAQIEMPTESSKEFDQLARFTGKWALNNLEQRRKVALLNEEQSNVLERMSVNQGYDLEKMEQGYGYNIGLANEQARLGGIELSRKTDEQMRYDRSLLDLGVNPKTGKSLTGAGGGDLTDLEKRELDVVADVGAKDFQQKQWVNTINNSISRVLGSEFIKTGKKGIQLDADSPMGNAALMEGQAFVKNKFAQIQRKYPNTGQVLSEDPTKYIEQYATINADRLALSEEAGYVIPPEEYVAMKYKAISSIPVNSPVFDQELKASGFTPQLIDVYKKTDAAGRVSLWQQRAQIMRGY